MKIYLLLRWSAFWIGFHYAHYNRRLCINFIPCCTLCIVFKGGTPPYGY